MIHTYTATKLGVSASERRNEFLAFSTASSDGGGQFFSRPQAAADAFGAPQAPKRKVVPAPPKRKVVPSSELVALLLEAEAAANEQSNLAQSLAAGGGGGVWGRGEGAAGGDGDDDGGDVWGVFDSVY